MILGHSSNLGTGITGANVGKVRCGVGLLEGAREGGDRNGNQNGNDGNNDQHFHQGEALFIGELLEHSEVPPFLKFYLYRPERGGRPGRYQIQILPYMENMGRYTASSKMTVMTASTMMMTGSRTASSRSVMVAASWSK